MHALALHCIIQHTTFEMPSFTHSKDMIETKIKQNLSDDIDWLTDHAIRSVTMGGAHSKEAKFCYRLWLQSVSLDPPESLTQTPIRG